MSIRPNSARCHQEQSRWLVSCHLVFYSKLLTTPTSAAAQLSPFSSSLLHHLLSACSCLLNPSASPFGVHRKAVMVIEKSAQGRLSVDRQPPLNRNFSNSKSTNVLNFICVQRNPYILHREFSTNHLFYFLLSQSDFVLSIVWGIFVPGVLIRLVYLLFAQLSPLD